MDPWQILYSFIGGFLGFGFALLTEALVARQKGKSDRLKTKENLIDELNGINTLMTGKEDFQGIIHFETPIWDAVVTTGGILAMLREDKPFYDNLLIIYNKLSGHKKMEENFSDNSEAIATLRKEIIKKISEVANG